MSKPKWRLKMERRIHPGGFRASRNRLKLWKAVLLNDLKAELEGIRFIEG